VVNVVPKHLICPELVRLFFQVFPGKTSGILSGPASRSGLILTINHSHGATTSASNKSVVDDFGIEREGHGDHEVCVERNQFHNASNGELMVEI